jgi:hypothetical protein
MSWTNQNKSVTTYDNQTKQSSTWLDKLRTGMGWLYNHQDINYNSEKAPVSGNQLFYNSAGTLTVWGNLDKS